MPWPDTEHLQAALVCLVLCAALGWCGPRLLARLPEPQPEPEQEQDVPDPASPGVPDERQLFAKQLAPAASKELYTHIAALPRLATWMALWSGAVGAAFGVALGWTGALVYLVPLAPVGVVLMVVDWRTTLLPTRILHPTYAMLVVLVPIAALIDQDLDPLFRAGWGWLLVGGWFWVFWWLFNAWGFGDVRLARVLGPALGYLGWSQLVVGLLLILFIGGIGGAVLAVAHRSLRRRFPYGPFMLVGAVLAVLAGPWLAGSLGY